MSCCREPAFNGSCCSEALLAAALVHAQGRHCVWCVPTEHQDAPRAGKGKGGTHRGQRHAFEIRVRPAADAA